MSDIRLIQLNNYVRPKVVESVSKEWVLNGKNNSFYDDLIDAYKGSPTNASIINNYTKLTYGKGLSNKNKNTTDWVKLAQILKPSELKKVIKEYISYGHASFQVIKTKGKKLSEISHIKQKLLAPQKENEDGEIEGYWYCKDWSKTSKYPPEFIPAFGTSNEGREIYTIKNYDLDQNYFCDPDWINALPYCQVEEELANFYIKSIKQGLSAGYIINVPDGNSLSEEEKTEFERQIKARLTGSPNALNFVLSFNGRDAEINIVPFPVNEQMHKQWDWLSSEATQKILTGHSCTSPSIVGIVSSSGFSNTADEMDTAETQLIKRVIQPIQNDIIEAIDAILEFYDISLDLYFKPLTEAIANTSTELSKDCSCSKKKVELSNESLANKLIELGEVINEDWEVVDERACEEMTLSESVLNGVFNFAQAPRTTDKKDVQDTSLFKIRYRYAGKSTGERDFCNKVLSANKVYRSEDLNANYNYNEDFAPSGSDSYNIFLYKGGVNCKHFWERVIYLKKDNSKISVNEARKMILELEPEDRNEAIWEQNPKEVAQIAESSNNYWSLDPNYRK